jgi:membrane-associated protease RseP (regulator of RpoE activity)
MMKLEEIVVAGGMAVMLGTLLYSAFDTPGKMGVVTAPVAFESPGAYPAPQWGSTPTQQAAPSGVIAAYVAPDIRLAEAHWQGLEAMSLTPEIKQKLGMPANMVGVLIDEVTLKSAEAGLLAGDVLVAVNNQPVLTLEDFVQATKRVKNRDQAVVTVDRKGARMDLRLTGDGDLGFAQSETAPMVPPGSIAPHPARGNCVQCHAIGQTGHIRPDLDGVILPPPPITADAVSPHRDRGPCVACHVIVMPRDRKLN